MTDPDGSIWGIYLRLLSLTYVISFASLFHQIPALDAIFPCRKLLIHAQTFEPSWDRFRQFPTFSWISPTPRSLQIQCGLGFLFAAFSVLGIYSWVSSLLAWAFYLSLATSFSEFLYYPWDCLLSEMGFLALLSPSLIPIWEGFGTVSAPDPVIVFATRFLLFRVMFGMGKKKFRGPWLENLDYTKWLMTWQPLPAFLAWYYAKVPARIHEANLVGVYLVEYFPCPWLIIFPFLGLNYVALVLTMLLQLGIGTAGNYGTFNVLTFILCIGSFVDVNLSDLSIWWLPLYLFLAVYFFGALLYLPWCSWTTLTWIFNTKGEWALYQGWIPDSVLLFYMRLAPFRLIHAWGVFGYKNPVKKGIRTHIEIQGYSGTTKNWHEMHTKYLPSRIDRAPWLFAPYQPRFDHQLWYEGQGQRASSFNFINPFNVFAQYQWFPRFLQLILGGNKDVLRLLSDEAFTHEVPQFLRTRAVRSKYTEWGEANWFQVVHTTAWTIHSLEEDRASVFKLPRFLPTSVASS